MYLQEFSEDNLRDPKYWEWLRDIEVVRSIYRLDYLMPLQFSEVESYVKGLWTSKNDCFFALYVTEGDRFIGTVRLGNIQWRTGIAEVGMLIGDRTCWRQGYATEALRAICKYAFDELSLRKITAGRPALNSGVGGGLKRAGFVLEGCLRQQLLISGEYCDHYLYGLFKDELILECK